MENAGKAKTPDTGTAHWNNIEVQDIVKALMKVTDGKRRKLLSRNIGKDGIWEDICKILFPDSSPSERDRYFAYQLWRDNRKEIQNYFEAACGRNPTRIILTHELRSSRKDAVADPKSKCFCERNYVNDGKDMVQCSYCNQWVHGICMGIDVSLVGEEDIFECMICSNEYKIPPVFETTIASNESEINIHFTEERPKSVAIETFVKNENKSPAGSDKTTRITESFTPNMKGQAPFSSVTDTPATDSSESSKELSPIFDEILSDEDEYFIQPKSNRIPENTKEEKKPVDDSSCEHMRKQFTFCLTPEETQKCFPIKPNRLRLGDLPFQQDKIESTTHYVNIFQDHFSSVQKGCSLAFHHKRMNANAKWGKFFRVRGECRNGKVCGAKWFFSIQEKPKPNSRVPVQVVLQGGTLIHDKANEYHRRLILDKKEEAKEQLRKKGPMAVYMERFAYADVDQLEEGNFNQVASRKTFQQIRSKIAKEDDVCDDTVDELLRLKSEQANMWPDALIPGYIQQISVNPFLLTLYTRHQFALLKDYLAVENGIQVMLDATGCFINPLGGKYDKDEPLLYTLISRHPTKKAPLVFLEFVSTRGDLATIHYNLFKYFETFRNVCGVKQKSYGITKLEVDFSKPMIAAGVLLLNHCTTETYIQRLWEMGDEAGRKEMYELVSVHVCRFHVSNCIQKKIKTCFKEKHIPHILKIWYKRLFASKDLWSFIRLVKDIAVICGYEKATTAVLTRLDGLQDPTDRKGTQTWKHYQFKHTGDPAVPFYLRNQFGELAAHIIELAIIKNMKLQEREDTLNIENNAFYSPDFLKYLKIHIFPYFPIISHYVLEVLGLGTNFSDDTTNLIEGYHKILKHDVHGDKRRLRITEFIRAQIIHVIGKSREGSYRISVKNKTKAPVHTSTPSQNKKTAEQIVLGDLNDEPDWEETTEAAPKLTKEDKWSPSSEVDKFKKPTSRRLPRNTVAALELPHLRWGAQFTIDSRPIVLKNTCNMDSVIACLSFMYKTQPDFSKFLASKASGLPKDAGIYQCMKLLFELNFDEAKKVWIMEVLRPKFIQSNMINSVRENGLAGIQHWFPIDRKVRCNNSECPYSSMGEMDEVKNEKDLADTWNIFDIYGSYDYELVSKIGDEIVGGHHCKCGTLYYVTHRIKFDIPWLVYALDGGEFGTRDNNLAMTQTINGTAYDVFAYTTYHGTQRGIPHIKATVIYDDQRIVLDGLLNRPIVQQQFELCPVTSVWLRKK